MRNYHYTDLKSWLQDRFNTKMGKIGLSLNTPCPNDPPCTFCNAKSFIPHTIQSNTSIKDQIEDSLDYLKEKFKTDSFIAYFQDNTSTYGDKTFLLESYKTATSYDFIKILSISTRPDYIDSDIVEIIKSGSNGKEVWIELGLQTTNDDTLKRINRGHDYKKFLEAYNLLRNKTDFKIGLHLILGLPGETLASEIEMFKKVNTLKPDYIKVNHLQVVKGASLENDYSKGLYKPLELNDYIERLSKCLSYLDKKIVVQRILASAHKNELIAPIWNTPITKFKKYLFEYMDKNRIFQGSSL